MKAKDLVKLGITKNGAIQACFEVIPKIKDEYSIEEISMQIATVSLEPENYINDPIWNKVAQELIDKRNITPRENPISFNIWGGDIEEAAIDQMKNACKLPVVEHAALMADAHMGYGVPIGSVVATDDVIIPYAVGVDIGCRLQLSVFDMPSNYIEGAKDKLTKCLIKESHFGMSDAEFKRNHDVMDDIRWNSFKFLSDLREHAHKQLGTSGGGNHFVEFGEFHSEEYDKKYVALLTHSGSRGSGAKIADKYTKIAMNNLSELPKYLQSLAWLNMDTQEGQEYWIAMNLMGDYAKANHECIHKAIAKNLGVRVIKEISNHHNFCWREEHFGKEYYVHRKGATPADKGLSGIIPGTMSDPCFIVEGLGNEKSLRSSSHGAGRRMSRRQCKEKYTWSQVKKRLKDRKIEVISAGIDECPFAYKDIHEVMKSQQDLVRVISRFDPRIVRMAGDGIQTDDGD